MSHQRTGIRSEIHSRGTRRNVEAAQPPAEGSSRQVGNFHFRQLQLEDLTDEVEGTSSRRGGMSRRGNHNSFIRRQRSVQSRRRFFQFGRTRLEAFTPNEPEAYRPLDDQPIDEQQRCLLDNLWAASSRRERLDACCALQYYFSKIMQPPLGKNFSYYALVHSHRKGIYARYTTLVDAKHGLEGAQWKGFYSFKEAYDFVFNRCVEGSSVVIEEPEPREGPFIETQHQRIRQLEAQIQKLEWELEKMMVQEGFDESGSAQPEEDESQAQAHEIVSQPEDRHA